MSATSWIAAVRGRATMICVWLGIVAASIVEIRLLLFDLPRHFAAHGAWTHIGVALAALLLALTILAALFRLPYARRHMQGRFVIKPVRTLKTPSAYSGEAIAALVYRDVVAWQSRAVGSLEAYASPSSLPQQMSVSVVGTSVPIIWIWTLIRKFVTGRRDVVIDGLLVDDKPALLKVWTDRSAETWTVKLEGESLPQALEKAISLQTLNILRAIDPVTLARIYWAWARYNEAFELMSLHDGSPEAKVDVMELCIQANLDEEAQSRLKDLDGRKNRMSKGLRSRTARLHGQILTSSGQYEDARKILEEALGQSGHTESYETHVRLAETYAYSGDHELAYQAFDRARVAAWDALSRILQERVSELSQLLDRARRRGLVQDAQNVLAAMHEVFTGQARCRKLAGSDDPLLPYDDALQVCAILRETAYPARLIAQMEAVILKAVSHHVWPTDSIQGAEWAKKAIERYDEAIELCKEDQETEPENMRLLTNMAWSNCGKALCIQRLLGTQPAATENSAIAKAVDKVVWSFSSLPPTEKVAFSRAHQRAFDLRPTEERNAGKPYAVEIGRAASTLATSLLRNLQENEAESVLEDWMQLSEGEMGQAMEVAMSKVALSESAGGVGSGHVQQLRWQLVRLLNLFMAGAGPSDIQDLITRAELRVARAEALHLCDVKFEELRRRREAHHRAEAHYVIACLTAADSGPDKAAEFLAEAIELTRRGAWSVIINRARMDEDFDGIRNEPAITSLLGSVVGGTVRAVG